MGRGWMPVLLIGAALWWLSQPAGAALMEPTGREPVLYWTDPTTGQVIYAPGLAPPVAGSRPASEWEVTTYYAGGFLLS